MFLFYEVLTLSTYPLVAHKGTPEAIRGARTYLGILIGTSIGLQLVAIIWTYVIAGTLDFARGGILEGHIAGPMVAVLLALYAFGIGKAALMPFHRWLPAAMVAPTPVSALLHAVAVVKAGVFTMLKVGVYIFGIDFLAETGASEWLMWLAAFSIIAASVVALTKDNLKARLAYSTVSQLCYITLGMALATSMGALGGGMHIAMHAMGKITLFMCAGSIYVATHKTNISQMTGLGRVMPITFGAFLIGALSIIGLPPLGGSWSKWLLVVGAADTGQWMMIGVSDAQLAAERGLSAVDGRARVLPDRSRGTALHQHGRGAVVVLAAARADRVRLCHPVFHRRRSAELSGAHRGTELGDIAMAKAKTSDDDPARYPPLGRALLWVEKKRNVDRIVYALYILCAGLFVADFLYHKHVYLGIEEFPGFYALYGFVMCAMLVICAKAMRVVLKRPEDYYAPNDVESEDYPEDQLERIDTDG